ncbi:hypothetical protein PF004_g17822 [Phytophthora fragariae]|uniref:Uncharacterized protein n=1 Tax=Phytophthora fragariae TaxID=53985 RepID=A0A6G0NEC2_9STRA|nr:hypothetical protein PF004_g17822 [Phytophthora fragariae]
MSLSFQGLFFHWIHENIAPSTPGFPFISVLLTLVLVIEMLLPSGLSSLLEWSALRYCGKSLGNTKATEMATDGVHVDSAQSKAMNLQVLKRQGADVMEIMDTASHVVMYECDILYTLAT